jgi:hypothetical protein
MQKAEEEAWKAKQEIAKLKKHLRVAHMAKSALQLTLESKERDQQRLMPGISSLDRYLKENHSSIDEMPVSDQALKQPVGILRNLPSQPGDTSSVDHELQKKPISIEHVRPDSSSKNVTFAKTSSTEDTSSQGLTEVECTLPPTEHGARILITDGSLTPPISLPDTVNQSSSGDDSILEVECTLETKDLGAAVLVNDRPIPSPPIIMLGVGVSSFPLNMVSHDGQSCPVEASMMGNASDVEYSLSAAAMVAKLLSRHEMRNSHETTVPRTRLRPMMSSSSSRASTDSPSRVLVWEGYESEQSNAEQQGENNKGE